MQFNNKEYRLEELYKLVNSENEKELEQAFLQQHISFSRIDFKEARDIEVNKISSYVNEDHLGKEDTRNAKFYRISRLNEEGFIDPEIGKVVDYDLQVTDQLSFDLLTETKDRLALVNVLEIDSEETLCKEILKVITMFNLFSRNQLLVDYKNAKNNPIGAAHSKRDIYPALLIFDESKALEKLRSLDPNSFMGMLIQKYHIHFFICVSHKENTLKLSDK